MAIEHALVSRARPQLFVAKMTSLVKDEVVKGCLPHLHDQPVPFEPPFLPLWAARGTRVPGREESSGVGDASVPGELVVRRVWISPEQECDWTRAELFIKQLSRLSRRAWLQIAGNKKGIEVTLSCQRTDLPVVWAAFKGEFEHCELSGVESTPLDRLDDRAWGWLQFRDYFPTPPYSHLLTSCDELRRTPFEPMLVVMMSLRPPTVGLYQCVLEPVDPRHNWHANVEALLDWEFTLKLQGGLHPSHRHPQQAPSGDLHLMSRDVETKAHNDKPFFFAAVRTGVIGDRAGREALSALSTSMGLFQHGGRPLRHLSEADYRERLPERALREMISRGTTYRHGFLVNSHELAGLVHVFQTDILGDRRLHFETLDTLALGARALTEGTRIGSCSYAGSDMPVRIPPRTRTLSTHTVSAAGMGKSTVMEHIFLQDIESGKGAMFIDAHGDSIRRLLCLIPRHLHDKCIYFKPSDPEWTPFWNPLSVPAGGDIYRLSDDIVSALKRIVTGWGDRLEHVLRNGLIGLSYLGNASLRDLHNLSRQKSPESEEIRKQIVEVARDEPVRLFWENDFLKNYRTSELQAPIHKLSKLLSAGPASRMLAQPANRIDLHDIMDTGKILLVDLSEVGMEFQEVLGSFMLALLLVAAVARSDTPDHERKAFALFVDEAHLFVSAETIECIITQARKFGVQACYAHQYLRQFGTGKIDALSTVGTTIIGRLDKHDAQYFTKDMQDLVDAKDIISLKPYEMIARIGSEIVRSRSDRPKEPGPGQDGQAIIELTHQRYCFRSDTIDRSAKDQQSHGQDEFSPLNEMPPGRPRDDAHLEYDELE